MSLNPEVEIIRRDEAGPLLQPKAITAVAPLNHALLLTCTTVGIAATAYAELLPGSFAQVLGWACLLGWVGGLAMLLYLTGTALRPADTIEGRMRAALRAVKENRSFATIVLLMVAGAAFSSYSRLIRERQGAEALARVEAHTGVAAAEASKAASAALEGQQTSAEILRRVSSEKTPQERLQALGVVMTDAGLCEAAMNARPVVLTLMAQESIHPGTLVQNGQFCLERVLREGPLQPRDWDQVLTAVAARSHELNRAYEAEAEVDIPKLDRLLETLHLAESSKHTRGWKPIVVEVQATPLMWTVWSGNAEASKALLRHGAGAQALSSISVVAAGGGVVRVKLTPASEAQRLGLSQQHGMPPDAAVKPTFEGSAQLRVKAGTAREANEQ